MTQLHKLMSEGSDCICEICHNEMYKLVEEFVFLQMFQVDEERHFARVARVGTELVYL